MHAVAPGKEPVHVIFCSKAGEPTLKSLQYPSRHIIIVSDQLTSRARAALALLPVKSPPTPDAKQDAFAKEAKQDAKQEKTAGASAAKEKDVEKDVAKDATKDGRAMTGYELKDVYIEAFVSLYFMFQLLKQRYLKCVNFSQLESKELDQVFDVFEKNRNLSHLPRMVETDPVARYLRLPTMSVVKQTRLSSSSGMQQSFRVVVREIKS
jgi:DNA-directed RNA polymerase subunit H (RpoH/RPB5)